MKKQLLYSTILLLPGLFWICYAILYEFNIIFNDGSQATKTYIDVFSCLAVGLVAGLLIGFFT